MNNQNLTIGSHIKVSRGFYTHHGIYCGDEQVVHYSGFAQAFNKGGIDLTSLDAFLGTLLIFRSSITHHMKSNILDKKW